MNGKPLDETTIKLLTDGEQADIDVKLDYYDENRDINYMNYENYYYYKTIISMI